MKINLYPLVSRLHDYSSISIETTVLLNDMKNYGDFDFFQTDLQSFKDADMSIIVVQSGGSEGLFVEIESQISEPYYLLTLGNNNSLAASIEILAYLKDKDKEAEILHGSAKYIASRLLELNKLIEKPITNLGIIGKPSDWLIASNVDYLKMYDFYRVKLIDIDILELVELYSKTALEIDSYEDFVSYDRLETKKALRLHLAINELVSKYSLKGFTIRCFDLIDKINTTGCLSLGLFNESGIVAGCEGDIPSMISMYLLKEITGQSSFMANPSRIDVERQEVVFAHCTIPLNMTNHLELMTHYESNKGIGLRGKLKEEEITIFKISNKTKNFFVEEGKIIQNLEENNLCRTQILVRMDNVEYFLTEPNGNHHCIVYGKHKRKIIDFIRKI
jgi:L-fucose isomerase-like protein